MVELVIYALLAAFIFSRLYSSLGKLTNPNLRKLTSVLDISQSNEDVSPENIEDYISSNNKNLIKAAYEQILQKDKNFSISHFMEGASMAFELIIKYFNQGNLSKLKPLLDKGLYSDFTEKIKQRKETYESIIVSITSQKILEIKLIKNVVFIAVYFLSEQINFVKDNNGNIISGSTSTINRVEDMWEFKKNINSSDPSWLLISINYNNDKCQIINDKED
ncbi:Tim44/TimA family putative adaptor protein [Wolbachia endosymbiont of Cruorifilaria tuberocauda]|uniref:Tim44/TimA family putative adaptor protein n=1 Tax=Wolbachia endosymbiont of Cruorifilaria tuberocauda TaxID=1812111 RepID=UPI00158C7B25|nr:Tim44/TimA family putative adaptor protein [Wolbachia endosymbiont of Cruorifilaria tuberocauda]QKX01757.1 Tim44/TimA family putative adaptor protein [Wolbachia endosymbiont of Cruorifilaria tuberocauda]